MVRVPTFLRKFNRGGSQELIFGNIRPAIPLSEHHAVFVRRVHELLARHLSEGNLGRVLIGHLDLVLDDKYGIVLHPPLMVVLEKNLDRLRSRTRVWGAPDIVLEVLTPLTARRFRLTRVRWYREWGVRECWLLDTRTSRLEVLHQFQDVPHIFSGHHTLRSRVLPEFRLRVDGLFC